MKQSKDAAVASYRPAQKLLHWGMAAAIIGMFALGLWMADLPNSPEKFYWYGLHKSIGSALLALIIVRYVWRQIQPPPPFPDSMSAGQKRGAHAGHMALYGLMLIMPLSGWLMSSSAGFPVSVFGWFTLPDLVAPNKEWLSVLKDIHELAAFALIGLAGGHALVALFHHFIKKDTILKRMMP